MMPVESINKNKKQAPYDHARLELQRRFLRFFINIAIHLLAKIERVEGLENIPKQGPVILMINHIAFIDSIVMIHSVPRNINPLAKIEVYDYPVIGIFPKLWHVIPVRRDEVDRRAIQQALEVLQAGEMILVAPEGTRGTALQQGKVGVAYLASRSQAPVIPVAIDGTVGFPALRFGPRWKEPGVVLRFGAPFRFKAEYQKAGSNQLRKMTDEAMYILAEMLPPERRGVYEDLSLARRDTICLS